MMIVLRAKALYNKNNVEMYKTYDTQLDRYGLFMPTPQGALIYIPKFLAIFPYEEHGKAPAVNEKEEYVWINGSWKVSKMTKKEAQAWNWIIIQNDKCLCHDNDIQRQKCLICKGEGQIENTFGDRALNKFFGLS